MKYKRHLAIIAAVTLLLLYVSTVVFALMDSPLADSLLLASIFCTVVIPAFFYGYMLLIKYSRRDK